ncbi:MAG TPA: hypothetical protein VFX47_02975 [Gammaproteobacteria bacterium]|nr:hypothetical protein [Gammaproteobacteria bacterium]
MWAGLAKLAISALGSVIVKLLTQEFMAAEVGKAVVYLLAALAHRTNTPVDDGFVADVAHQLGVPVPAGIAKPPA